MGYQFEISADSIPVYDTWGWDDFWSAQDWIRWHKLMKQAYGLEAANIRFIEAYHKAEFLAASWDWNTFNFAFIDYAKANGFYNALFTGLAGLIQKTIGAGTGVINDATEIIDDAGSTAKKVTNNIFSGLGNLSWTVKITLSILLLLVGFAAYQYVKKGGLKQFIIN